MGKTEGKSEIFTIFRKRIFSKEDATALLRLVRKITAQYADRVDSILNRLEVMDLNNTETIQKLENEANDLINQWHSKIEKLGVKPKGLWYVDFDFGQGCFCWKYPEADLFYWHSYEEGFSGRKRLKSPPSKVTEIANGEDSEKYDWSEDCSRTDQLSPRRL